MYADDVVILSTSKQGLQNCVNKLEKVTAESEMSVNIKKTKVLVFNKAGRIKNIEIEFKEQHRECVQQYTYLGVVFAASGSFSAAKKTNSIIKVLKPCLNYGNPFQPTYLALKRFYIFVTTQSHCRQRAPIENAWSTSGIF